MSKVHNHNGQEGTSTAGMYFHAFSGRPVDQYESPFGDDDPRDHIGDTVLIVTRAELTAVVTDHISDGKRNSLKLKVIDSQPGKIVAKADGRDPNQTSIDDVESGEGEYSDYTPPAFDDLNLEGTEPEPELDDEPDVHNHPFKVV